jgi:IS5 family transposase
MQNEIHEKGYAYHPSTEAQKASNREKSRTRTRARSRSRVEHVFGFMTNSMKRMYIRTIGYTRATAKIGLTNLTAISCVVYTSIRKSMQSFWDKYLL